MSPKRKRGGASCPCPKCGGSSRVSDTRRTKRAVRRQRRCANRKCGHEFATREAVHA